MLWQSGEADVNIYRCPLLTYTPGGNLLVVAEGRKGTGDGGLKFIATRRSSDGGAVYYVFIYFRITRASVHVDNILYIR